ncbi:Chaperone protein DNAj, putative isoform 1 [Hibiscus syriacus]|uniref:Chaperone protein DNAj, putative isoform 1 n=1 Tax=Hibiscus syriacus TaxID=106335 RepID=A0A6A2WYR5_HIBSY|nr:Chaperone protein DNAj, putative isoform 1 [Hibiscus syriacus]
MDGREPKPDDATMRKALLVVNCIILSIGNCGGPLIARLYFIHGGKRDLRTHIGKQVFLHETTCSSPPPSSESSRALTTISTPTACRLPVSTSSLIIASELAFTAGFAFLLVKQKFSAYSINAVFLLTIGAGVLALHSSSDRPENESNREYILGFLMTIAASALYGFILSLVELTYKKANQEISYALVMEIQMVMFVCYWLLHRRHAGQQ